MAAPKIKICGLTGPREALELNQLKVEYAGLVLFFEKSKRYNRLEQAWQILAVLDAAIKKVAVVVSPTVDQILMIEKMGFDIVQIHGTLEKEAAQTCRLPIWRAYNVVDEPEGLEEENRLFGGRIQAYVLDGKDPGAGKTFDWEKLKAFDRRGKLLVLAGGLTAANIKEGIAVMKPDVVDVSSGVEYADGNGKDPNKMNEFVRRARDEQ